MKVLFASGLYLVQAIALLMVMILLPVRFLRKLCKPVRFLSLWGGRPIINMGVDARAERMLGVNAKSFVYTTYYITSAFDYNMSRWFAVPVIGKAIPFLAFIFACLFADRLHFHCDRGFLPSLRIFTFNFLELYAYRLIGIEVFLWTYGADVRSRKTTLSLGEPNCCTECTQVGRACICDETARVMNVERLKKCSTALFSMGDMIEYTPGSRNGLFFWPVDLQADNGKRYAPVYPIPDATKPLRIVHAPNHRMFKGTHFLIEAVDALQSEGVSLELILVERIPNEKALEIYRSADVVFDQCLVGFHGYFAVEAMALGKPVMCFIRKPAEYLLHADECPLINTHVSTLKDDVLKLAKNREQLRDIGITGRRYIEKYFTLEAFAQRLKMAYEELGVIP